MRREREGERRPGGKGKERGQRTRAEGEAGGNVERGRGEQTEE